ncbi:MAG: sensor histidine kinase, partial [Boseongicola sp.]|nr:sensor histidine kinase [Boseongicola sp.]
QRAITNLVDNALKYGRRATLSLDADADIATITVDDEGAGTSAEELETLMAPFQRGSNVTAISGFGLGLTIVSAIAKLHGGTLTFEDFPGGLRACLRIARQA